MPYCIEYYYSSVRPVMRNATLGPVLHSESPLITFLKAITESQLEQHIFPNKKGAGAPGVNNSHARGHARTHRLTVQAELKDISISARAGGQNPR